MPPQEDGLASLDMLVPVHRRGADMGAVVNDVEREAIRFHNRMTSVRREWVKNTQAELERLRKENATLRKKVAKFIQEQRQG